MVRARRPPRASSEARGGSRRLQKQSSVIWHVSRDSTRVARNFRWALCVSILRCPKKRSRVAPPRAAKRAGDTAPSPHTPISPLWPSIKPSLT
jgi:hypothetical protein